MFRPHYNIHVEADRSAFPVVFVLEEERSFDAYESF